MVEVIPERSQGDRQTDRETDTQAYRQYPFDLQWLRMTKIIDF